MALLTASDIESALLPLPGWSQRDRSIARTFQFGSFAAAMAFVNEIAALAEQAWHHPDIDIRYKTVTVALTTHDEGGLTERDFSLARAIDAVEP